MIRIKYSRRGFTLIEILVATGITALLAGIIIAVVANVGSLWSRSSGRLSAEAQARYVFDQLSLDLSSAIYRDDGHVWLAADVVNNASGNLGTPWQLARANAKPVSGLSLAMTTPSIADARFGNGGVWLRFFTTKRGSNNAADPTTFSAPVAVGYQILRRFSAVSTTNQNTGYFLHRVEARPITSNNRPGTLEFGFDIATAPYSTSTSSTNDGSNPKDPRAIERVSSNPRDTTSIIAENVIDFGVRCYVRDAAQPTGLRLIFPAADDKGTLANNNGSPLRSKFPSNTPSTAAGYEYRFLFPDVVEVMVRILTDDGARLIASFEQPNSTLTLPAGRTAQQYWWDLAIANSRVFTRRIVVNSQGF